MTYPSISRSYYIDLGYSLRQADLLAGLSTSYDFKNRPDQLTWWLLQSGYSASPEGTIPTPQITEDNQNNNLPIIFLGITLILITLIICLTIIFLKKRR